MTSDYPVHHPRATRAQLQDPENRNLSAQDIMGIYRTAVPFFRFFC